MCCCKLNASNMLYNFLQMLSFLSAQLMLKSPHINSVRICMTGETSKYRYEEYVVMIAYILM